MKTAVKYPDRRGSANANYRGVMYMTKACATCGNDFLPGYAHKTRKFCSMVCAGKHPENLKLRLAAARSAPRKKRAKKEPAPIIFHACAACGNVAARPGSKTCSKACMGVYMKATYKRESKAKITSVCRQCGVTFEHFRSNARLFCTYPCFLKSGGPLRAGLAARTMVRKYGAKKDANHKEIVEALEKCGCSVLDLSEHGRGLPDLLVHHCNTGVQLVEIKNTQTGYGRRGANENQKAWANGWPAPVYIIKSIDDVDLFVNGKLREIEHYGGKFIQTAEPIAEVTA